MNNHRNPLKVALNNSSSFKYKVNLIGKANVANGNDRSLKDAEIVLPLKYLSNLLGH